MNIKLNIDQDLIQMHNKDIEQEIILRKMLDRHIAILEQEIADIRYDKHLSDQRQLTIIKRLQELYTPRCRPPSETLT